MTGFKALLRLQLLSKYADLKPRNLKTALKEIINYMKYLLNFI